MKRKPKIPVTDEMFVIHEATDLYNFTRKRHHAVYRAIYPNGIRYGGSCVVAKELTEDTGLMEYLKMHLKEKTDQQYLNDKEPS